MSVLHFGLPIVTLIGTILSTYIFVITCTDAETGIPLYLRTALFIIGINNIFAALIHWFLLPDGGLECIAKFDLGPPSPARTVAIALIRKEGQERFWTCCILMYVAVYFPQLTIALLYIQLAAVVSSKVTNTLYRPLHFKGEFLAKNAPGQFRFVVNLALVVIPLLYAYSNGDL